MRTCSVVAVVLSVVGSFAAAAEDRDISWIRSEYRAVREGIAHVIDDYGYTRGLRGLGSNRQPEQETDSGGSQVKSDCRRTPGAAHPGVAVFFRRTVRWCSL